MSVLFAKFQTIRTLPLQRSARVEMNEKTSERVLGIKLYPNQEDGDCGKVIAEPKDTVWIGEFS
jgi:hypothetical protein